VGSVSTKSAWSTCSGCIARAKQGGIEATYLTTLRGPRGVGRHGAPRSVWFEREMGFTVQVILQWSPVRSRTLRGSPGFWADVFSRGAPPFFSPPHAQRVLALGAYFHFFRFLPAVTRPSVGREHDLDSFYQTWTGFVAEQESGPWSRTRLQKSVPSLFFPLAFLARREAVSCAARRAASTIASRSVHHRGETA
jgi:hypothetical protein